MAVLNLPQDSIVSFLLERLTEDDKLAADAETADGWWTPESLELDLRLRAGDARLIAAWSPARIRADGLQRRALIDWADELALRIMAEPYRDHPDYAAALAPLDG